MVEEVGLKKGNILRLEYLGWRRTGGGENGKEKVYCFIVGKKARGDVALKKVSAEERREYLAAAARPPENTGGLRSRRTTAAQQQQTQQRNITQQVQQASRVISPNTHLGASTASRPPGTAQGNPTASTLGLATAAAQAEVPPEMVHAPANVPKIFDVLIKKGEDADRLCVKTLVMKPLLQETLDLSYPLRTTIDIELHLASQARPWRTTLVGFPGSRVAFLGKGKELCRELGLNRRDFLRLIYKGYFRTGGGESGTDPVYCFTARKKVHGELALERGGGRGERPLSSGSMTLTDEEESEAESEESVEEESNESSSSESSTSSSSSDSEDDNGTADIGTAMGTNGTAHGVGTTYGIARPGAVQRSHSGLPSAAAKRPRAEAQPITSADVGFTPRLGLLHYVKAAHLTESYLAAAAARRAAATSTAPSPPPRAVLAATTIAAAAVQPVAPPSFGPTFKEEEERNELNPPGPVSRPLLPTTSETSLEEGEIRNIPT